MVRFDIHTNMKWAAFGLVPTNTANRMVQLSGQYCATTTEVITRGFYSTALGTPEHPKDYTEVTSLGTSLLNGWSTCSFQRPLKTSNGQLYDLDRSDLYSVLAVGDSLDESYGVTKLQYHGGSNKLWYSNVNYTQYPVGKMEPPWS